MKVNLKIAYFVVLGLLLMGILYACNDDKHYTYYMSMATVEKDDAGYAESFVLDDGTTLHVTSSSTSYKPTNERVIISYDLLDNKKTDFDREIHLNGYLYDILTKPIIYIPKDDQHLQDSIGSNKINVFSMWVASDYINMKFGYNTSNGGRHMLNLVSDSKSLEQVGEEPIKLQFRHKVVEGEEFYASGDVYVSFKLDEYIKANTGKREDLTFEVQWEEYSGKIKTETLKVELPREAIDPPQIEK